MAVSDAAINDPEIEVAMAPGAAWCAVRVPGIPELLIARSGPAVSERRRRGN